MYYSILLRYIITIYYHKYKSLLSQEPFIIITSTDPYYYKYYSLGLDLINTAPTHNQENIILKWTLFLINMNTAESDITISWKKTRLQDNHLPLVL